MFVAILSGLTAEAMLRFWSTVWYEAVSRWSLSSQSLPPQLPLHRPEAPAVRLLLHTCPGCLW